MGTTQKFSITVKSLKNLKEIKKVLDIINARIDLDLPGKLNEDFERDDLCGDYPSIIIREEGKNPVGERYYVEIAHESYYSYRFLDILFEIKKELCNGFKHVSIGHLNPTELDEI